MARKGALAKEPTKQALQKNTNAITRKTSSPAGQNASKWTRIGAGTYKDQYGNVLRGQKKAPVRDMSQRNKPAAPTGPANEPPPNVSFEQLDPGQQIGEMADVGGDLYGKMADYTGKFNPQTFQQQYEPQFQQAMDRARQSVMNQFEQRNAQAFQRERQDFETSMANRGIAPGGPQYNRELQALTDRQDRARQESMNAAEQAAQSIQAQGYQQATGVAMLPGELQRQYQDPVMAQYGQYANMMTAQFQAEQERQRQAEQFKQRRWEIKNTPRSNGGGGGGMDPFQQYQIAQLMDQYNEQGPKRNPMTNVVSGVAQGVGTAITGNLLK
jgi:hypothetical protein